MKSTLASLGHKFLALDKSLDHLADFLQSAQNNLVALDESIALVLDGGLVAELANENLESAQVVARHTREEMVNSLELQTSVQEVEPLRAVDVHGSAKLALREALGGTQVGCRHAPVAQGDLNVQKHGDAVRNEDKCNSDGPGRKSAPQKTVAKDSPVASHEENLDRASPPSRAQVGGTR